MSAGNIRTIRPGVEVTEDIARELLRHVESRLGGVIADGYSPRGIAFVVFSNDPEGKSSTSAFWHLEHTGGPAPFAVAYAAAQLQADALGLLDDE